MVLLEQKDNHCEILLDGLTISDIEFTAHCDNIIFILTNGDRSRHFKLGMSRKEFKEIANVFTGESKLSWNMVNHMYGKP